MTSAQTMRTRMARRRAAIVLLLLSVISGCQNTPERMPPKRLVSDRPQVWAVAPFANESGVSTVKTARIADFFMEQAQQIVGVNAIAVNRVLMAMREMGMDGVTSVGDARRLMNVLEVDGLIVGTVTSFDPYRPPKLGAAIQLYMRYEVSPFSRIDTNALTRQTRGEPYAGAIGHRGPAAEAAGYFDAANHQTLNWLHDYATGRTEPQSAYGEDIYLVNMDLYTQFVSFRLLHDLLEAERGERQAKASLDSVP